MIGRADRAAIRIVESGNEPAFVAGDGGARVALQLAEIGAFLIPDDQIAAPVERPVFWRRLYHHAAIAHRRNGYLITSAG